MQAANTLTIPTILTEQYPKGLGSTVEGVSDHFSSETPLIEKTCFACSGSSAFCQAIANNQRKQVILAGMESHICVLQTALELRNDGYHVYVVEDAVCSRYELNHHNAISRMRQMGITIINTESVLFEWLRDARHEHFKALSALIK